MGYKMKKLVKLNGILLAIILGITSFLGCTNKKEAVIISEDITEEIKEQETVEASTADKFNYSDLVVDGLKLFMTESEVIAILGDPVTTIDSTELPDKSENQEDSTSKYYEIVYSYNELSLIFMKLDDTNHAVSSSSDEGVYKLTAAASISEDNTFSRGLKVGEKLEDILAVYYRDQDYMNNYYKIDDSLIAGNYLYGDSTIDTIEDDKIKGEFMYGLIDYTGYSSLETAEEYMVSFTCFDDTYKNTYASIADDFAQLIFDMNNDGEITAIRWYYYPEEIN